jgi:hypothetical protein
VFVNDYVHEQFLSICVIHQQVFENELMWLHDRQANEHRAKDNHFDWKDAMVHGVMMRLWTEKLERRVFVRKEDLPL